MSGLLQKIMGGGDKKEQESTSSAAHSAQTTSAGGNAVDSSQNRLTSNFGGAQSGEYGGTTEVPKASVTGGLGGKQQDPGVPAATTGAYGETEKTAGAGAVTRDFGSAKSGEYGGSTGNPRVSQGGAFGEGDTGLHDRTSTGFTGTQGNVTSGHPSGFDASSGGAPGNPANLGQGENDAGRTAGGAGVIGQGHHGHHGHHHHHGHQEGELSSSAAARGAGLEPASRGGAGGFDGHGEGWNDSSMGAGVAGTVGGASHLQGDQVRSAQGEPGFSQGGHHDAKNSRP